MLAASTGAGPFGTAYRAIHIVTMAIDPPAFFIIGMRHFYMIGGSVQAGALQFPQCPSVPCYDDADGLE